MTLTKESVTKSLQSYSRECLSKSPFFNDLQKGQID